MFFFILIIILWLIDQKSKICHKWPNITVTNACRTWVRYSDIWPCKTYRKGEKCNKSENKNDDFTVKLSFLLVANSENSCNSQLVNKNYFYLSYTGQGSDLSKDGNINGSVGTKTQIFFLPKHLKISSIFAKN